VAVIAHLPQLTALSISTLAEFPSAALGLALAHVLPCLRHIRKLELPNILSSSICVDVLLAVRKLPHLDTLDVSNATLDEVAMDIIGHLSGCVTGLLLETITSRFCRG
jgi:hypothetical protein